MTIHKTTTALLLTFATSIAAHGAKLQALNPRQFIWKAKDALPVGAFATTVHGDPATGAYDFIGRFPKNFEVPMHWHTHDVNVLILEGSMVLTEVGGQATTINEGGFVMIPGGMRYRATCEKPCTFLAHGTEPFDLFYADPSDDPRLR